MPHPLITLGHGRLDREELAELLRGAQIQELVDVRRFPGSRSNPAAARGQIEDLCQEIGILYRWDERLGGRRRLDAQEREESPDTWWRVEQFQAYAAWTRSEEYAQARAELVADLEQRRVAVLCSEAVWWRCHRRIIADTVLLLDERPVLHLMHDGKLREAEPSEGARIREDGQLVWDGADED